MPGPSVFMHRCLELAARGEGLTAPNPMVGAVLFAEGRIIGEGYHSYFGGPHAEVNAINAVKAGDKHLIAHATLFVNLEPCNHFGKTPPCAQMIIENKIPRVVIGALDPNNSVSGGGMKALQQSGIEVIAGIEIDACRQLNKNFYTYHEKHRPFITLKWAQSADGFIAADGYKRVHYTNAFSDGLVQRMRSQHMAICVGGRTVVSDNPHLTNRSGSGRQPLRVVIDTRNNLSSDLHLLNSEALTMILNYEKNAHRNTIEWRQIRREENIVEQMMEILFNKKIDSVLVEGGAATIQMFIASGMWDAMQVFIAPISQGTGIVAPERKGQVVAIENIFGDELHIHHNI